MQGSRSRRLPQCTVAATLTDSPFTVKLPTAHTRCPVLTRADGRVTFGGISDLSVVGKPHMHHRQLLWCICIPRPLPYTSLSSPGNINKLASGSRAFCTTDTWSIHKIQGVRITATKTGEKHATQAAEHQKCTTQTADKATSPNRDLDCTSKPGAGCTGGEQTRRPQCKIHAGQGC